MTIIMDRTEPMTGAGIVPRWRRIARDGARPVRPALRSDIPLGTACLALVAAHDLAAPRGRLDLDLLYGPSRQTGPGATESAPSAAAAEMLARVHLLWLQFHDAVAGRLVGHGHAAAGLARAITREVYRDTLRHDLLGAWLMPRFRDRYAAAAPRPVGVPLPVAFMTDFADLAGALLREAAPDERQGDDAPGRDWLEGFSRLFAIGSSVPRRLPAIGPRYAAVAAGRDERSADGLVLRDWLTSARGTRRSVGALIGEFARCEPRIFAGCFAQDERHRQGDRARLHDAAFGPADPLAMYLMLEAEADTGGRRLGALGSLLLGESIAAGLPREGRDHALETVRQEVFGGAAPASMAGVIRFVAWQGRGRTAPLAA